MTDCAHITCLACGGTELSESSFSERLLRCGACGLHFLPDASQEELHRLYDAGYFELYPGCGAAYDDEAARAYEARVRARWTATHAAGGSLLEVGAASGWFLKAASDRGFEVAGIEPEPRAAAVARSGGFDVAGGPIEEADLATATYDVVCLWHVLEHLAEPGAQLERLCDALRPGGLLVAEVPNIASYAACRMGTEWPWLDLEHHVSQFTPDALEALVSRAGIWMERLDTFPAEAYIPPRRFLRPPLLGAQVLQGIREWRIPRRSSHAHDELIRVVARAPSGEG